MGSLFDIGFEESEEKSPNFVWGCGNWNCLGDFGNLYRGKGVDL